MFTKREMQKRKNGEKNKSVVHCIHVLKYVVCKQLPYMK